MLISHKCQNNYKEQQRTIKIKVRLKYIYIYIYIYKVCSCKIVDLNSMKHIYTLFREGTYLTIVRSSSAVWPSNNNNCDKTHKKVLKVNKSNPRSGVLTQTSISTV